MHESPYVRETGYAERYRDRRFRSGTGAGTDLRERRALARLLQAVPAADPAGLWLDAPSGAGRMSDALPGPTVQVDRDLAMVQAIDAPHPRVCASVHALPFADGTFAGALCMRLLQHIPTAVERITILREFARVTRGPIIVSFFDAHSLQHLRRRLRPLLGGRRSGRHAVARSAFADELAAASLEPTAMQALRRYFGEQTLVLCHQVER